MILSLVSRLPCRTCICKLQDDCVRGEFSPYDDCRASKRGQERCVEVPESRQGPAGVTPRMRAERKSIGKLITQGRKAK